MARKIRISWIPRYDLTKIASTRIRLNYLHKTLEEEYPDVESVVGFDDDADVIILQKVASAKVLAYLAEKKKDRLVLFDYDDADVHELKFFWNVMEHVDIMVADTPGRFRQIVQAGVLNKDIIVLPDCIDYDMEEPQAPPRKKGFKGFSWFGYHTNVVPMSWQFEHLAKQGHKINLITNCKELGQPPKGTECITWAYDYFIYNLRKMDLSLLSHEGQDQGAKSNNKMIVSITAGLPVISGPSRSYDQLLNELDLGWASVCNTDQLDEALSRLRQPAERKAYLDAAQPAIWSQYSRQAVTKQLVTFLREKI
jgi:hypothetical protein